MTIAMKIAGHRSVDTHVFEHRLEWRSPVFSLIQGLNSVAPVPVGGQCLIPGKRREAVAIGEAEDIIERRLRLAIGHEIEDTHALDSAWRGVDPGIIETGAVVHGMANTHAQFATSRASR